MKHLRLLLVVAFPALTGCAVSLAPSEGFNDWTNSAIYRRDSPSPATVSRTLKAEPPPTSPQADASRAASTR